MYAWRRRHTAIGRAGWQCRSLSPLWGRPAGTASSAIHASRSAWPRACRPAFAAVGTGQSFMGKCGMGKPVNGKYRLLLLSVLAGLAALGLHGYPLTRPFLFDDDFAILLDSWTWADAWTNLWRPWNEHAMPLGRLFTAALVQLAGQPTALP